MRETKGKNKRDCVGWRTRLAAGVVPLLCAGGASAGTVDFADGSRIEIGAGGGWGGSDGPSDMSSV